MCVRWYKNEYKEKEGKGMKERNRRKVREQFGIKKGKLTERSESDTHRQCVGIE